MTYCLVFRRYKRLTGVRIGGNWRGRREEGWHAAAAEVFPAIFLSRKKDCREHFGKRGHQCRFSSVPHSSPTCSTSFSNLEIHICPSPICHWPLSNLRKNCTSGIISSVQRCVVLDLIDLCQQLRAPWCTQLLPLVVSTKFTISIPQVGTEPPENIQFTPLDVMSNLRKLGHTIRFKPHLWM